MTLPLTLALATACLALALLFGWLGARPAKPLAPPRLAPWRFLMLLAFALMVMLLIHVFALLREPGGPPPF